MVKLVSVDLGKRRINIPIIQIKGKKEGKRLIITAGTDGDEYAGIEAAYQLAYELEDIEIEGEITIIPILNIPGFEAGVSFSPQDNKYPKNIFPGKENGTASEKLIFWLFQNYILNCDVWIDLHGGAYNEALTPFLYAFETKNKRFNNTVSQIISFSPLANIVYAKSSSWSKVDYLAKKGIIYLLVEAGQKGERDKKWIDLHLTTVKSILSILGIIKYQVKKIPHQIFNRISIINSNNEGLWYPKVEVLEELTKDSLIGEIKDIRSPNRVSFIKLKQPGICLWIKSGMFVKKSETLAGFGCN